MACELEEYRELANNRINELERLQRHLEDKVAECASLNMQVSFEFFLKFPDLSVIWNLTEFR